jgi:hypothetical protein
MPNIRKAFVANSVAAIVTITVNGCTPAQLPWPKSAGTVPVQDWRDDGGESLAPKAAGTAASSFSSTPDVSDDEVELSVPETATPK